MRRLLLNVDSQFNILRRIDTFDESEEGVEVTLEEFNSSKMYKKFNPETREFTETIEAEQNKEITEKQRIEQLEETVGILAEQLAKQTLGM